eukprot:m.525069 g.525069  ORF g.525069 m.525069 type:complete len:938 (+) comp21999_c0_seq2:92-2905(+)
MDSFRLLLAGVVAIMQLCTRVEGGFCTYDIVNTTYSGCWPGSKSAASFNPPCVGSGSTLYRGAQMPFDGTSCAGQFEYFCSVSTGMDCCPGYNGPTCTNNIDACASSPCGDYAVCIDNPPPAGGDANGRVCECSFGYEGDGETCTQTSSTVTMLKQDMFNEGSLIISRSGVYRLAEDIEFNPNSLFYNGGDNFPTEDQFTDNGGIYDRRAYSLGFFAAIVVEASHVEIDLNGHSMIQSVEHALRQRFYAHIELANAPFAYDQGPHNFTNNSALISAHHISIYNGHLGRASHHGIHGNGNSDLVVKNVTIDDFEVAGISLNGGSNIVIEQVVVGPSRVDVPVVGLFSTGVFILPYVEKIVAQCPTATITLNKVEYTGQEILDELKAIQARTFNAVVCGVGTIPEIVSNLNPPFAGKPDGAALYGIVLHNYGTHTQGYVMERNGSVCLDVDGEVVGMVNEYDTGAGWDRCVEFIDAGNVNLQLKNVRVVGLDLAVNEVEALTTMSWDKNRETYVRTAQWDVVGAVYQYEVNVDKSTGQFHGNPISNAQLFVTKHLSCLADASSQPEGMPCARAPTPSTPCMRDIGGNASALPIFLNTIRQSTLDWAAQGGLYSASDDFVICGGDNMFHVNKGALGIRVDAGLQAVFKNIEVDTIRNSGKPVSTICTSQTLRLHPHQSQQWYTGTDAVGVSFAASSDADFVGHNVIRNILSSSGNAYGIQLLQVTDNIRGRALVGTVQTLRGAQFYPSLSANQIYDTRPNVHKHGGLPEAQTMLVDKYACIPGDNMEMFMDESMRMDDDDDNAPADVHTMTCRFVVDLEPASVFPITINNTGRKSYSAHTCPDPNTVYTTMVQPLEGTAAWQASFYNVSTAPASNTSAKIGKNTFIGVLVACLVILGVSALLVVNRIMGSKTNVPATGSMYYEGRTGGEEAVDSDPKEDM